MSVVCKLFIQNKSESPDGSFTYSLGAVCRGEENKDWAAATPSGSMNKVQDEVLDAVWARPAGQSKEVLVYLVRDDEGTWEFQSCDFTYGGCQTKFRRKDSPWSDLSLTINASAATESMRRSFAEGLIAGKPPKYSIIIRED